MDDRDLGSALGWLLVACPECGAGQNEHWPGCGVGG